MHMSLYKLFAIMGLVVFIPGIVACIFHLTDDNGKFICMGIGLVCIVIGFIIFLTSGRKFFV